MDILLPTLSVLVNLLEFHKCHINLAKWNKAPNSRPPLSSVIATAGLHYQQLHKQATSCRLQMWWMYLLVVMLDIHGSDDGVSEGSDGWMWG